MTAAPFGSIQWRTMSGGSTSSCIRRRPQSGWRILLQRARVQRRLGRGVAFDLVWTGPWTYRNQIAKRFRCGNVFLVGDSAHAFSPFGGRGGNSGVQDAENLVWKLAMVMRGEADPALLNTYETERHPAAELNIAITSETARFLHPPNAVRRLERAAILRLAPHFSRARKRVNTGRLSLPFRYSASDLSPGEGASIPNVEIGGQGEQVRTLLDLFAGPPHYVALAFDLEITDLQQVRRVGAAAGMAVYAVDCPNDAAGEIQGTHLRTALDVNAPTIVVLRPDMHIAVRLGPEGMPVLGTLLPRRPNLGATLGERASVTFEHSLVGASR